MLLALLPLQAAIALTPNAVRMDALLRELTQKSGVVHRATGDLAGRIMLTVGKPRPVAEIREDLAAANWAQWKNIGGEWRIELDREAIKKRDATRQALRIASFEKALKVLRDKPTAPFDQKAAKELLQLLNSRPPDHYDPVVHDRFPNSVALRHILLSVKPETYAARPLGRHVFSDKPTVLQRSLPEEASTAVRRLEDSQRVWSSVYLSEDVYQNGSQGISTSDPRYSSKVTEPNSLRCVLILTINSESVFVDAKFADRSKNVVLSTSMILNLSGQNSSTVPDFDPQEEPLPLKPLALRQEQILIGKGNDVERAQLANIAKNEPLDGFPAEIIRAISLEKSVATTLWLDDNLLDLARHGRLRPDRLNSASQWISQICRSRYELRKAGNRLVFAPLYDLENTDRATLSSLLKNLYNRGFLPLNEFSQYARNHSSRPKLIDYLFDAVMPASGSVTTVRWETLQLWGLMTSEQRSYLDRNDKGEILLKDLPQPFRDQLLARIVTAETYSFSIKNSKSYTLDAESTEILANGFPMNAVVTIDKKTSPCVQILDANDDPMKALYVDVKQLGLSNRMKKLGVNPYSLQDKTIRDADLSLVRSGTMIEFLIRVPISNKVSWVGPGSYYEIDGRAKSGGMSEEMKKKVDELSKP